MKNFIYVLMFICTIFTAFGQLFLKKGIHNFVLKNIFFNNYFIFGLLLYFLATIIFIFCLSKGELSFVFPILTFSYVWIILLDYFYFNIGFEVFKCLGIFFISLGLIFLGMGVKK